MSKTTKEQTFYGARRVARNQTYDDNKYTSNVLKSIDAEQVGGGDGLRYYSGKGMSFDRSMADSKANLYAMKNMLSHSDSLSYKDAISQFPDTGHWKGNPKIEEEFFNQWGYYPSDVPKDNEGYDLSHDEMIERLKKGGKMNLFDLKKIGEWFKK